MTKVFLVTGCSIGLGISIAVQAAQAGHAVYATVRNLDRRAALDSALTEYVVTIGWSAVWSGSPSMTSIVPPNFPLKAIPRHWRPMLAQRSGCILGGGAGRDRHGICQ